MPNFSNKYPHPALTVDIVIFSIHNDNLHILLVQRGKEPFLGKWALPGGFVNIDESLVSAAMRELEEETGITGVHFNQLFTFGDPNRDPRGRVVSISYYSIIHQENYFQPSGGSDASQAKWMLVDELPSLAFDHEEIISYALNKIRNNIQDTILEFDLLPRNTADHNLRRLFEIIQGKYFPD
jgi:8-oxo-dGTP diphosphatase